MRLAFFMLGWLSAAALADDASCFLGPVQHAPTTSEPIPGLGRTPDARLLAAWDIDVGPEGAGLPAGRGSVSEGAAIYQAQCASCHGANGEGGPNDVLVADADAHGYIQDKSVRKAIGNYWPYATTLFDYVRRAMPFTLPGSLRDEQVYAVSAYLLHLNGVLPADAELDRESLAAIELPAAKRLRRYDECRFEDP